MLSSTFSSMVLSEEPVMTFVPTGLSVVGAKNVQEMERKFISETKNVAIEPIQVFTRLLINRFFLVLLLLMDWLKKLS